MKQKLCNFLYHVFGCVCFSLNALLIAWFLAFFSIVFVCLAHAGLVAMLEMPFGDWSWLAIIGVGKVALAIVGLVCAVLMITFGSEYYESYIAPKFERLNDRIFG